MKKTLTNAREDWNPLPPLALDASDLHAVLKVLAKSTLWLPRAFLRHVEECNVKQKDELLCMHPARDTHQEEAETFFAPHLAVGFPFVRRLIASERKGLRSWLHRYHTEARVILDDNRIPKRLWSYAWCGRNYSENKSGPWKSHGFRRYEASHVLPHKKEMHEDFFREVFENDIQIDPSLLFLSAWNNLLVDKRVAGLTDNSPVVTAVLLHEIEHRYNLDLGFLGRRRQVVLGIEIKPLAESFAWWTEPPVFRELWGKFADERMKWLKARLNEPKYRTQAALPPEVEPQ